MILELVEEARKKGASEVDACRVVCVSARTLERWRKLPNGGEDGRRGPNSKPAHTLTPEERARVIDIATSPRFRNLSVRQIVPTLADEGVYVASESSFYRVLHERKLMAHRSHVRPSRGRNKPRCH
jgi:putative transposase